MSQFSIFPVGNNCTLRGTKAAPRGKNCNTEARRDANECILASSRVPKLESRLSLFQAALVHADQSHVGLGSRPPHPPHHHHHPHPPPHPEPPKLPLKKHPRPGCPPHHK